MRTLEVLHCAPESQRAAKHLAALAHAAPQAGLTVTESRHYDGQSDLVLLWGPGAQDRFEPMRQQIAKGGHVLALDLSYWDRDKKFRLSIDAPHPQSWVMRRPLPASRLQADGVKLQDVWNAKGPVIVAGIGDKAGVQYGKDAVIAWERRMIAAAQAIGRKVQYRPKKANVGVPFAGVPMARSGSIDQALTGASLVVTWHSNVAVDAIRLGVPAICRDGAAAAVCPSEWQDEIAPLSDDTRRAFLQNLAWFQWAPDEASAFWAFVRETLT